MKPKVELTGLQQLAALLEVFGHKVSSNPIDVFMEVVTLFPEQKEGEKLQLKITEKDNHQRKYNYGCDAVTKKFEEEFENQVAK